MNLKKLRKAVDNIDKKIIRLLNLRAKNTLDITKLKLKSGKSIYSPDREREVVKRIALLSKGPLGAQALEAIYREVMSSSLSLDKPLQVAYLGPQATFTHLAALKRFGSQVEYISCNSITDVF